MLTKRYTAFQSTAYSMVAGMLLLPFCSRCPAFTGAERIFSACPGRFFITLRCSEHSRLSFLGESALRRREHEPCHKLYVRNPAACGLMGYLAIFEIPNLATFMAALSFYRDWRFQPRGKT
jgi:hypothetical protein